MERVRKKLDVSERRACAVVGQHRSTQRKPAIVRSDEERLTLDIIRLAREYGRYGILQEVQVLIERWREHYNTVRPHSSLGYRPPAPQAILPKPPYASLQAAQRGTRMRPNLSKSLDH